MLINYTNIIIVSKRKDIIYCAQTYLSNIIPVSAVSELNSESDYIISLIIYDCSYATLADFEYLRKNFSRVRLSKIIFIIPIETPPEIKSAVFEISRFVMPYPCKKDYLAKYIKTVLSENMQEITYNSIKKAATSGVYNKVVNSLFGSSEAMSKLKREIINYASFDSTLLLCGESGTGKSTIARLIHQLSSRKNGNFVGINSSVISNNLADAALFGAVEGAYTDCKGQQGFFQDAEGGTLFFDEISSTSLEFQSKLLTVLDSGEFYKVGSHSKIKVNVRTIFATNEDLEVKMMEGLFRKDLYYRISANIIRIPPLRERRCDIVEIAKEIAKSRGKVLTELALKKLEEYSWPGNVRQLEQCIERAEFFSNGNVIDEDNIIF